MQVQYGTVCPEGFLPAYSVDDEATARSLVVLCCPLGLDGEYYARELFDDQGKPLTGMKRIEAFVKFGQKLERAHGFLKK